MPIPTDSDLSITPGTTKTAVETVLQAKYNSAIDWAQWAATMLEKNIVDLNNLLGEDVIGVNLADIQAAISAIAAYTPPAGLTYIDPAAPTYTAIPAYSAPTLGTRLALPTIADISVGVAPATVVSFDNADFSSTLGDALTAKLTADMTAGSTGLGNAEAALFARETARQNDARAAAYAEVTTQFASRGFDMPPGALLAKQTEANNESNIRLSDSSSQIMAESARLAVDYNKTVVSGAVQLVELMSRIFDSKIMRSFEASKNTVMMAIESFKQTVNVAIANADVQKKRVDATVSYNDGTVKTFLGEIEGQTAPMKAIADSNQASATAYRASVEGAKAALEAQVIPEDLKIKGLELNARIGEVKGRLAESQARVVIDSALRQLQLEVTTLSGLAQNATQLIAGALNGVSVSVSEGWSGSTNNRKLDTEGTTGYTYDVDGNVTERKHNPDVY